MKQDDEEVKNKSPEQKECQRLKEELKQDLEMMQASNLQIATEAEPTSARETQPSILETS